MKQDLFNSDRSYYTGQSQQGVDNNLTLAGIGAKATGAVDAAGQNYANNASNSALSTAAAQNNASLQQANTFSNLLGQGINAYAYTQGRSSPAFGATANPLTVTNPYGSVLLSGVPNVGPMKYNVPQVSLYGYGGS